MRPVCAACMVEMHPKKNGVAVAYQANGCTYGVYLADLWTCDGCGHEIVTGFGNRPVAEVGLGHETGITDAARWAEDGKTVVTVYESLGDRPLVR